MTTDGDPRRQRLLEAVVSGELAATAPEIRAACAADPTFEPELRQLLALQTALTERATTVREDLAESAGALHGNAAAALRAELRRSRPAARRTWPWLAVAAAAFVAIAWWSWSGTPAPSVPQFLGGVRVQLTTDGCGLELKESLADWQYFHVAVFDADNREVAVFSRLKGGVWSPPTELAAQWTRTWRAVIEVRGTEGEGLRPTVVTDWLPVATKR